MRVNGPLPTAGNVPVLVNPLMSATWEAHTCSGTIGTSELRIDACGAFVTITSVRSSLAVTDA